MKRLALLLITTFIFLHAIGSNIHSIDQYPIDKTKIYSLGSIDIAAIGLGASFDTLTKVRSYANKFPNISNKALTYIESGKRMQLDINCKQLSDIKNFNYVVLDDSKNELLSGSVKDLTFVKNPLANYTAELPILNIENKVLSLTVYNRLDPEQQGTVLIYNKAIPKPEFIFLNKQVYTENSASSAVEMKRDVSKFVFDQKSKGLMIAVKKNDYSFIYSLLVKEKKSGEIVFKEQSWNYNYFNSNGVHQPHITVDKQYFKYDGEYEIIVQPELKNITQKEVDLYSAHQTIVVDIVKSYSVQEMTIWSIVLITLVGGTAAILLYSTRRRIKQKIKEEHLQKQISETKLTSIQSQLNPHFLFNALATIQSFVNDNDIDNANRYLSKFARLTRHVLETPSSNSIVDEQLLLEDYLQMEQLRFGFKYKVQTNNLDINNLEIPSMLLQPIVENAIKHGIPHLKELGEINILFDRDGNDLLITIIDNGKGYDVAHAAQGLGLKLTNERIALWNELHRQELISLASTSNNTGTSVYLTFKNWL